MSVKFTAGADPEFFLMKDGKHVSAIGLINGSKMFPRPLDNLGHAVLEDNVAVEFNIPAADSYEAFRNSIQYVMAKLREELPGYDFSKESAISFDASELQHPQATEFGCDPDFNAWTGKRNPPPRTKDLSLRSAGGHIHIGTTLDKREVIKAMDLFLGVPSIKLDNKKLRRKLYGKAGAFRPKDYGCEYRTLSNFWIFDEGLINWAYKQTQRALDFVDSGEKITLTQAKLIQNCINKSDEGSYELLAHTFGV